MEAEGSMVIEKIKVADLSEDPANARAHGEKNLSAIVASLRRFGQQKPIVIDKSNVVRAGNGTLQAARQLGWETVACVRTELSGVDAVSYAIADNRTAELAVWDEQVLVAQLESLQFESDELLNAAGYTDDELKLLLESLGKFDIDETDLPSLADGDKLPFQQMTFKLHDSQAETVSEALKIAKQQGEFDSENENSNGNALARVCEEYLCQVQSKSS